MRIIDKKLYERFLSQELSLESSEKEFFSYVASISPFSFWVINRLPLNVLKEIYRDHSFDEKKNNELLSEIKGLDNEESFMRELRVFKYKELLKLIIRDVFYKQVITVTLYQQSYLAISIIKAVYEFTKRSYKDLKDLTILALGKLGSEELNFSSDIDIVYVYEDDEIENVDKYNKWAVKINQILSQKTDYGFLYRVDNDLRPGGKYSPLAMSSSAFINFYYIYGETWQRLALLRLKFICGDLHIYEALRSELEGYIYRKYLDFSMIKDLHELKNKIDLESKKRDKDEINVKLGKGGIREAEFFIYTFQIINGGKNRLIREGNISLAIERLVEQKFIEEKVGKELKEAYLFLRQVENYIQMDEEAQKYTLPDGLAFERLIKILEIDKEEFFLKLNTIREKINTLFKSLFREDTASDKIERIFQETDGFDKNYLIQVIEELGIKNTDKINSLIDNLEIKAFKIPAKYHRYLKKFIILLFKYLVNKDIQNKHIVLIEDFLDKLVKNPVYLPLISENQNIANYILNVFFLGHYLARILINYPETLEFLITADTINRKYFSSYYKFLKDLIDSAPDFEMKMRILRQFKNSEWLKIGVMESNGIIDTYEMELYLTNLAEACLILVFELCKEILEEKYGSFNQEIAILGMGKMGSYEMTYFSDLDLIVIYESNDINASFYNSKLIQRLISTLSMVTKEGELYKVDMRLRPTGSQGPLVTTFDNFKNYHMTSWVFEKQALTRGRVLGQKNDFSIRISNEIEKILYENLYDKELLKRDIFYMKKKIDQELASKERKKNLIDIKTGEGGLMDIEFIIQYFKLAYGKNYPLLRALNPKDIFSALREYNLLPLDKLDFLEKNYIFFKVIERNLRTISGFSKNSFLKDEDIITELIDNLKICMSRQDFFNYILEIKGKIRNIFNEIFTG